MTIQNKEQNEQIIAVLNYLKNLQSLLAKKNLNIKGDSENCKKFEDFRPIDKTMTVWDLKNPDDDVILSVEYRTRPRKPAVPETIKDWVTSAGENRKSLEVQNDDGTSEVLEWGDDPKRQATYDAWLKAVAAWREEVQRVKEIQKYFHTAQAIYSAVEGSGYQKELVLGTMIFENSPDTDSKTKICYPLLTRRLSMSMEVSVRNNPVITFTLDDESPAVFESLPILKAESDLSPRALQEFRKNFVGDDVNPLDTVSVDVDEQFKALPAHLGVQCRWADDPNSLPFDEDTEFCVYKKAYLIVRDKNTDLREEIDDYIDSLKEGRGEPPTHVRDIICGVEKKERAEESLPPDEALDRKLAETAGEDQRILLVKPANFEQLEIAREIRQDSAVVVQGPPGTGKTHTIVNLLSNFLAEGKRVLVTSASSHALTVLKEKMPASLQPLCITMIEDKRDLEKTSTSLVTKLTELKESTLKRRITEAEEDRVEILNKLRQSRRALYEALEAEKCKYSDHPIAYNNEEYKLDELAQWLHENDDTADIIPGPVSGNVVPLTADEMKRLYSTNGRWTADQIKYFKSDRLAAVDFPKPEELSFQFDREKETRKELDGYGIEEQKTFVSGVVTRSFKRPEENDFYLRFPEDRSSDFLSFGEKIDPELLREIAGDPFLIQLITIGRTENSTKERFKTLASKIRDSLNLLEVVRKDLDHTVSIPDGMSDQEIKNSIGWVETNCPTGELTVKQKIRAKFLNDKPWSTLEKIRIARNNANPFDAETRRLIQRELQVRENRDNLKFLWNEITEGLKVPEGRFDFSKNDPKELQTLYDGITKSLEWWKEIYEPFFSQVTERKFTTRLTPRTETEEALKIILEDIVPTVAFMKEQQVFDSVHQGIRDIEKRFEPEQQLTVGQKFLSAIRNRDVSAFRDALEFKEKEDAEYKVYSDRERLLQKLAMSAQTWAAQIRTEASTVPPEHYETSWKWKRLNEIYTKIVSANVSALIDETRQGSRDLRKNTTELVEAKAWNYLKQTLENSREMQSLRTVAVCYKQLGKGTGKSKKAAEARRTIRALMPDCQKAIPVWIMPIDDALASFHLKQSFDCLIIDEASQADISKLPILLTAKKAIIVGDDKQVSPISFAKTDQILALKKEQLGGKVPRDSLYMPGISLYDICQTAFKVIMLREHFRCVPDIIGFSNQLSYDGQIKPLRDAASTNLLPALVDYRVPGLRDHNLNKLEAHTAIRIIRACLTQPEYQDKTFGIIPMLSAGDDQVTLINQLISSDIPAKEVKKHKIHCGLSKDFQGDERDVIILSLIDSVTDEKQVMLRTLGEGKDDMMKKRYNVAVSRAKDQLWVVHSIDWRKQLTERDLRWKLLSYMNGVNTRTRSDQEIERDSDSVFENRVAKHLRSKGYEFTQQYPVGAYRIDIVVAFNGKKIALECDGEEFHSRPEDVMNDMSRQSVLERNGWRFIRLCGSEFFRNEEKAMERVYRELAGFGIYPKDEKEKAVKNTLFARVNDKIAAIRKADEEARERDQASETEDDAILAVEVEKIADAAETAKTAETAKAAETAVVTGVTSGNMTEKEGEAVKSENGPLSYQTPGAEVTIETDLLGDPVKPAVHHERQEDDKNTQLSFGFAEDDDLNLRKKPQHSARKTASSHRHGKAAKAVPAKKAPSPVNMANVRKVDISDLENQLKGYLN